MHLSTSQDNENNWPNWFFLSVAIFPGERAISSFYLIFKFYCEFKRLVLVCFFFSLPFVVWTHYFFCTIFKYLNQCKLMRTTIHFGLFSFSRFLSNAFDCNFSCVSLAINHFSLSSDLMQFTFTAQTCLILFVVDWSCSAIEKTKEYQLSNIC